MNYIYKLKRGLLEVVLKRPLKGISSPLWGPATKRILSLFQFGYKL